ncbi:hypothetical protein D9758_010734 [Tetrapyrgos nigripes]|uniref:Heme haloperoxidase family profile domain-containing protein n=1 Tax=Tetrapyrgos nigripes TaxID=182062 RepID=A0A8H5D8V6_9AGAR|nr:hypothetical protein D9758_010734 [Tetrapyrgos nigripes]
MKEVVYFGAALDFSMTLISNIKERAITMSCCRHTQCSLFSMVKLIPLFTFCVTRIFVQTVAASSLAERDSALATIDLSQHQWIAPGPNDLRGPCPGLNTLANHGFLPRDGRNLNMSVILDAGFNGYHMQSEALALAVKLASCTTDDPFSFTLDDIKLYVRPVSYTVTSNTTPPSPETTLPWATMSISTKPSFKPSGLVDSNPGSDVYNTTSAGRVQQQRSADDEKANPNITNTSKEFFIRSAESAFYLSVMGNPLTGVASKNFVQIFFREERLPIEEGWKRSETPINKTTLAPLVFVIQNESNWTSSGGCFNVKLSPGPVLPRPGMGLAMDVSGTGKEEMLMGGRSTLLGLWTGTWTGTMYMDYLCFSNWNAEV